MENQMKSMPELPKIQKNLKIDQIERGELAKQ